MVHRLCASLVRQLGADASVVRRYQGMHCAMEAGRRRCDWKNALTAGLVTGGFMGLPVALRAGEPKLALVAAGLTGGICCFLCAVCCVSLCLMW